MTKKCNVKKLQGIQRTCCVGICGAMRTAPTSALEILLYIHPIDIQIKSEAAISERRLRALNEWIEDEPQTQHQRIMENLEGFSTTDCQTDRISGTHMVANCTTRIGDGSGPEHETYTQDEGMVECYTDASKSELGVGIGIYIHNPRAELVFHLPMYSTILQAEIRAITECLKWLQSRVTNKTIRIFTDSQNAIRSLRDGSVKSRTLMDCKETINEVSRDNDIFIGWIPGHQGFPGNVRADELAKIGRESDQNTLQLPKPFMETKKELREWMRTTHASRWHEDQVGRTAKETWGNLDHRKTRRILGFSKDELSKLTGVITGHSSLRAHLFRIGCSESDECRACGEDAETAKHFLCQCPAFSQIRKIQLGEDTLEDLSVVKGIDIRNLRKFIEETQFLT